MTSTTHLKFLILKVFTTWSHNRDHRVITMKMKTTSYIFWPQCVNGVGLPLLGAVASVVLGLGLYSRPLLSIPVQCVWPRPLLRSIVALKNSLE